MSKKTPTKAKEEEDDSTNRLAVLYRRKCEQLNIPINPIIRSKLQVAAEGGKLDMLGSMPIRALMEALIDLVYQHLKKIRVWKGGIGDEGVRFICKYKTTAQTLELIDLLDNGLTALGCQFLGKSFLSPLCRIKQLKLDDNTIGAEGLRNLAIGLRESETLDKLSLKYCGIEKEGAKWIQEIVAKMGSKLRSLKLQGNPLENEGIHQVLRAVECSDSLMKINLADTKMNLLEWKAGEEGLLEQIGQQLVNLMRKNMLIVKYDIRYNQIPSELAQEILRAVQSNPRIRKIEFPNSVKYDLRDNLDTIMRKRNKKNKTPRLRGKSTKR